MNNEEQLENNIQLDAQLIDDVYELVLQNCTSEVDDVIDLPKVLAYFIFLNKKLINDVEKFSGKELRDNVLRVLHIKSITRRFK